MTFRPFEVTPVHLIYVGLGFFIVIFGILSLFIKEKLYLGEAPLAAIFGIIVGPAAINLFDPADWGGNHTRSPGGHITNEITLEVMRVTIALSVFAVGVELPKKYVLRHWRSLIILLGPVMLWGWMVTAGFITALIPGLDFLNSLVIAACVTPTDPILAQAVVGGPWAEKHVPAHIRHMLMCESGCNDGAAFPFLYLALFLTTNRDNTGKAIAEWFYDALAYQIIFGTILGALIGFCARKAMRFSERHHLVDRESFVAQYISLAIASMGVNVLLGSDDLLAAFACGTAFAWDGWFTRQTEDSNFSNIVDLLFNVATFIYIGALMPWYEFAHGAAGNVNIWRLFVLAIAVLLLRRFPVVLALWRWIPDIKTFREAIFSGHFAPMGVGAIFIATLGRDHLPEEVADPPETSNDVLALSIQPIVFFLVLCSITVHGLTVPFFAFSKRATTLTRTWSRNPSFSEGGEPGWMNRMRRFKTGDTMASNKEVEGGGMTEIQRVLNAQLGVIGKGAIGGDAEKELRRDDSTSADDSSGSRTRIGLLNTRTERDLELAEGDLDQTEDEKRKESPKATQSASKTRQDIDDLEDWEDPEAEDPSCEWGGDNTAEMKMYRAKRQARKEAAENRRQHDREGADRRDVEGQHGDLGEAPMDREMIWGSVREEDEYEDVRAEQHSSARRSTAAGAAASVDEDHGGHDRGEKEDLERQHHKEAEYPKARSWLEGNTLVIEYSKSRLAEPEVHVINLSKDEAAEIAEASPGDISESEDASVAHAWMTSHFKEFDEHIDDQAHRSWHPAETARELVRSGALQSWLHGRSKKSSESVAGRAPLSRRAVEDGDESEQEQRDRADMLYAAMNWRGGQHYDSDEPKHREPGAPPSEQDDSAMTSGDSSSTSLPLQNSSALAATSSRSNGLRARRASPNTQRRSSNSSSRTPSVGAGDRELVTEGDRGGMTAAQVATPRPHASGRRRPSMRRKILSGKIGLGKSRPRGGQKGLAENDELVEDDDTDEFTAETSRDAHVATSSASTPTERDASKSFPRTGSLGGLSLHERGGSEATDVVGVLRTREELQRERAQTRTPTPSVSFLTTDDTNHDRAARGNTFVNDRDRSANSSASSGLVLQQGSDDGAAGPSDSSSSNHRKGPGQRISAFFNALGGSGGGTGSSHGAVGNGHDGSLDTSETDNADSGSSGALAYPSTSSSSAIEAVNLPHRALHHAKTQSEGRSKADAAPSEPKEEEPQDPVAAMFFGKKTSSSGSGNRSGNSGGNNEDNGQASTHTATMRATPGPISMTYPEEDESPMSSSSPITTNAPTRQGTPREGILSSSGGIAGDQDSASQQQQQQPSVAFDLSSR